ncbi:MAG: hypothetical protein DA408_05640 [Bacteroidetes bacterium]|nr:MAG: hypothetical protein C7N36_10995 [Bacteroidota bacterium]PTM13776.1 MAG: hypothetical protein DA408_05640 [Bacteroidota bacterium]
MENSIIDRLKSQAKNLQTLADELKVQMALGKAEAKDLIEKERKELSQFINRYKEELEKADDKSSDSRRDFLTCVENLESSLLEAVPAKPKAYDAYKKKVLQQVYQLEDELRKNYPTMGNKMQDTLDSFKAKMDAFRVNLALHDKDKPEKVDQVRAEFTEKLEEVRTLLSEQEQDQSKLDNFMGDIKESFDYLKKAIADLSN